MEFLTNDKLVIVGAGGAIGSTMVQTALTMKLTPNVCLYDVYAPGMEGVMEEMFHCGQSFPFCYMPNTSNLPNWQILVHFRPLACLLNIM